jgi:CRP-like cAMP-binding protein
MRLPEPFNQLSNSDCKQRIYDKDHCIFRQGDKSRGIFFVINGSIELRRYTSAGAVVVIHVAKSGETFAEASLFSDTYHCDAYVAAPSELIELNRKSINHLFDTDSAFARTLTRQLTQQIQHYRRKVELLSISNATERVFCGIVEGLLKSHIKVFSTEIGLSHEVVYRSLSKLVAQGKLIKLSRGRFVLPD